MTSLVDFWLPRLLVLEGLVYLLTGSALFAGLRLALFQAAYEAVRNEPAEPRLAGRIKGLLAVGALCGPCSGFWFGAALGLWDWWAGHVEAVVGCLLPFLGMLAGRLSLLLPGHVPVDGQIGLDTQHNDGADRG